MGALEVIPVVVGTDIKAYSQLLFTDLRTLEYLIREEMIEEGVTRIGVEQELCLVDNHFRPAPWADEVLAVLNDESFTNELAKFNLEINMEPLHFREACLSTLQEQIQNKLDLCTTAAADLQCTALLTGILPTIRASELEMSFMTPRQRYKALNSAIQHHRKGPHEFYIQGVDQLITRHSSVMFESCNTSFQAHYQLGARNFAAAYNWAQAISAGVLACSTNSPIFMGKRLWQESRIALFQQATDTRGYQEELRKTKARVWFGDHWVKQGLPELVKEDISTYRPLVIKDDLPNSWEMLQADETPTLKAFSLYNGTIYRWNRPCYGITDGKPHLRIENRYLPAGPTVIDEVANAAFWWGLMHAPDRPNISEQLEFFQVKSNFINAARHGLSTKLHWTGGSSYEASDLLLNEFLPLARQGLNHAQIAPEDVAKYLEVIEERVTKGITGATWMLNTFNELKKSLNDDSATVGLTEAMLKRQLFGEAVSAWSPVQESEITDGPFRFHRVDQIMSKKLYTVFEDDIIDLVPNIMKWNQIRHMLVEDQQGNLVGLVTMGRLGQYYAEHNALTPAVSVKDVMVKDVITLDSQASTLRAIELMIAHKIGCLPILNQAKKLVGIVTERDFFPMVQSYLQENPAD